MELTALKTFARRLSEVSGANGHKLSHGHALDIISAAVGLRDWNAVAALPARMREASMDFAAASRVAARLKRMTGVKIAPSDLHAQLMEGADLSWVTPAPAVWVDGPPAGIYFTTSLDAVGAAVARFEETVGGLPVYTETLKADVGDAYVDLGEYGLFSLGLLRLPAGQLFVVGPIALGVSDMDDSPDRIRMAARLALEGGHRVLMLCETQAPEALLRHVRLMLPFTHDNGDRDNADWHASAMRGHVAEDGSLVPLRDEQVAMLVATKPAIRARASAAAAPELPSQLLPFFETAIACRRGGILMVGAESPKDVLGRYDDYQNLVAALIGLTDGEGPVALVPGRTNVYDNEKELYFHPLIAELPRLPSFQAAHDAGYRRIVYIDKSGLSAEAMRPYTGDTRFITGTYGGGVAELFLRMRFDRYDEPPSDQFAAIAGITTVPRLDGGTADLYDAWRPDGAQVAGNFTEEFELVGASRQIRREAEALRLMRAGVVDKTSFANVLRGEELMQLVGSESA